MNHHLPRLGVVFVLAAAAASGLAQGEPAGALRVELAPVQSLCSPQLPIWVRFTLHNTSDQTVEIPLTDPQTADSGVALPLEVVLGTAAEPAVLIGYQDEKPVAVQPPAAPEGSEASGGTLRLAPHGSVGTTVDLREHFRALRYSGDYRVEWRPLGGRAGTASGEFRVEPRKEAILVTDKGKVTFALMYDQAPLNVRNFLELARDGFYDGKIFHRIIPGFLVQGGCPKGDGTGMRPDGKTVPAEFHDAPFQIGTLAMARKPSEPDSGSCQFFISLGRLAELDGQYTVIGQASDDESLRTLNQIASEPTDQRDRPRLPFIIRSINLVDAEGSSVSRFNLKAVRSASSTSTASPEEPPKNKP